jgi:FkbM family methyltransferase
MTRLDYWVDPRPEIEEGYHKHYPLLDEAYFEWIDLLQTVTAAQEHFTMVELGAGWGRWTANAVAALRQVNPLPYTMVVVEAEPTHFGWMKEHLERNGVDLNQCQLVQAAVAANDGSIGFFVGEDPTWGTPNQWYGQSIGGKTQVPAVSLNTLLAPLPKVDLLDMDIQGAEYEVIEAAAEEVNRKVKRVHIETHNREVERGLRLVFTRLGWKNIFDYPCSTNYPEVLESKTDFGIASFVGGRQSWVNPKFMEPFELAALTDKAVPTVLGFELRADPTDSVSQLIMKDGLYEAAETDLVSRLVRPKDVCVDDGCHSGYYACFMGLMAGPEGRIYAFDANPLQVQRTRRNAEINGLHNIEAIHAAPGEASPGGTPFDPISDGQGGLSSLGNISSSHTAKAPRLRLDNFLRERQVEHIRLLKLGIEEATEILFQGLGDFLANHAIDFILLAGNDKSLKHADASTNRIVASVQANGYSVWQFDGSAWTEMPDGMSRSEMNQLFASPSVRKQIPNVSLAGSIMKKREQELQDMPKQEPVRELELKRDASIVTPAEAFWRQREMLRNSKQRIKDLSAAIGRPSDFSLVQWAQIAAFTQEFRPDLILELGRGEGNSTACFTEVAQQLGGAEKCHVLSLCLTDTWRKSTVSKIRKVVANQWFLPLEARECDILTFDIAPYLQQSSKTVVFWDAHGFEVAEWVLGYLLPQLASRPHRILMHDLSDMRYCSPQRAYGKERLWKGTSGWEQSMWLGNIHSRVAQSISVIDFTGRNKVPLHSGDESFFEEIGTDPEKFAVLQNTLGGELFQLYSYWFWFSLAEAAGELTFPRFEPPPEPVTPENSDISLLRRQLYEIRNSRGWRLLTRLHGIRNRLVPAGSRRRKLYDSVMRSSS